MGGGGDPDIPNQKLSRIKNLLDEESEHYKTK